MRRILATALISLSALFAGSAFAAGDGGNSAAAPWWQNEWKYRKPITLDGGQQGAALAGNPGRTPVLLRLHAGNFKFEDVAANGADLRFVASDNKTVLNHQVEQFDPKTGIALVWLDVPALDAKTPQTIYMYFGNPKAPVTSDGQKVFDPDYTLIYHFADANAPAHDVTAYGNNASKPVPPAEGAVIGQGARMAGTPVELPGSPSLAIEAGKPLTISMWVKPAQLAANQVLYARHDGASELVLGLDQGAPFVQVNGKRSTPGTAVKAGGWSHVAMVADKDAINLFVNGQPAGQLAGTLPAFKTAATVGADSAPGTMSPFAGDIDELRISRIARPAALLQADAISQGAESRLTKFGPDEESAGKSHFAFIIAAMPPDAWAVIGVLSLMMLFSWFLMIRKGLYFGSTAKANAAFNREFHQTAGSPVSTLAARDKQSGLSGLVKSSALWRLYQVAMTEIARRRQHGQVVLSPSALSSIRASMDTAMIHEQEKMAKQMNWLSTTIEGAPYVGLFGTVIGIMLVFVVAAMAGAVDINSVAPGMAAALLCTAAGLGVAIPALFGYNWLSSRSEALSAQMAVFVEEFSARMVEEQDAPEPAPASAQAHRA